MCRLKSQEIQPSTISSTSTQHSGTVCVSSGWLLSVVGGGDLSTCVCVCVCVCVCALECRGQTFGWPGHQSLVKCWNDSSPEGEQTALAIALPSSSCQHPADWHTHTHTHTHSLSLSMTQRPVLPKPLTGDVKVNYFKMCADKSVSTRRGKNNKSASFGQPNAKNINTLLHRLSGSLMQFSSLPLAAGYWPLNLIWIRTPISSISEHAVCPTLI